MLLFQYGGLNNVKIIISVLLVTVILICSFSCSFVIAANAQSIDSFIDSVEELNEAEESKEKTLEESAGSTLKDNRLGIALEEETGETLDISKYDYPYYYCVAKTHDGNYKKDIITGESNINIYNFNDDGIIDIQDVSMLLTEYGNSANANTEMFDLNGDEVIDLSDLSIELSSDIYGAAA